MQCPNSSFYRTPSWYSCDPVSHVNFVWVIIAYLKMEFVLWEPNQKWIKIWWDFWNGLQNSYFGSLLDTSLFKIRKLRYLMVTFPTLRREMINFSNRKETKLCLLKILVFLLFFLQVSSTSRWKYSLRLHSYFWFSKIICIGPQ